MSYALNFMNDQKKRKIFTLIMGGAGVAIAVATFFTGFLILIADSNPYYPAQSSQEDNNASVYVLSGKIIDIQDKTVILETPIFDIVNGKWLEDKKEMRKLIVNNETKFFKNNLKWIEEKKRFDEIVDTIKFEDLKIGYTISANHSQDLAEVKDFSPETITILSI